MWYLRTAFKVALEGRHQHSKVGALLLKGGQIIAKAANMSRPYGCMNRGYHAEERILKNIDATGCVLVVVRLNKNDKKATMSRPCSRCWPLVKSSNVKKVVFINWDGKIEVENVRSSLFHC